MVSASISAESEGLSRIAACGSASVWGVSAPTLAVDTSIECLIAKYQKTTLESLMKHNRNPLAKAIHYSLGASMVAGLAMTAAPVAAQDEEAADLDRVQVTGSRIKRTDVEGALPIQVIDRQQIELSGTTSVADLLRQQPINSAGSFRPQSGSSGQSFAGLSLRALGSGRTLILVDGRRAPNAPNIGTAQDLNAVPLGAVERIEILSDGASAIYGADAIGGVVNIITRSDFDGVEAYVGTSDPKRAGGDTREAGAIFWYCRQSWSHHGRRVDQQA